jgi:Domain of unknown function (DUF4873)
MAEQYEADAYTGPAGLRISGGEFGVQAELRGHFEPVDGRYHWYGRLARHDGLAARVPQGRASGLLTTPHGSAHCELSDPDPWGRYRVTGVSTPPFRTGMALHAGALPSGQDGLPAEAGDE